MTNYTIVGGPCTGKTTLINALKEKGFNIITETAREVIAEGQEKNLDALPWINRVEFQKKVLKKQLEKEKKIRKR